VGALRATYVIEAVDKRGNVSWLDYVTAQLPSSGVPPGVARPVDVPLSGGPPPGPTIASLLPAKGAVGTQVTIKGTSLLGTFEVRFGDVVAPVFAVLSSTSIKATVPTNAVTGPISVTTATGTATSSQNFTVLLPPSLSIANVRVRERNSGQRNVIFRVWLSGAVNQAVAVSYATSDGTAVAGSDYVAKSGTLTFPPYVRSRPIVVPVLGDQAVEGNETFVVTLSGAVGAPIARAQGIGTIVDDDHVGP
jgi:hypothetical protein